ncbi:SAM-dependent methyltransferase [Streptomyces sp. NTH33]|uniref:SAM-dependent methyltransferase n=1 Tax=Streptomyces sp. NTH33 TaxID=1735453 RepID=UPI00269E5B3F
MSERPAGGMAPIDSSVAHPARVHNAWLGGDGLPSGSHLVISHPASDITAEEVAKSVRLHNERAGEHAGATPRPHERVTRFFEGTELLEPGVVQLTEWHPDADTAVPASDVVRRRPQALTPPVRRGLGGRI